MKQLPKTAITSLPILFYLIISLICSPIFGQEKSATRAYKPEAITDAFSVDAVTIEDMVERAKYYPYMPEEIVVAVELNSSKAIAKNQIREYNWSQFFGNKKVTPIAYLMTKEINANKSVSLVHLSLAKDMDVFEAMQMLNGNADILWSSPNFHIEGDPREIIPNDPDYDLQYHHPLMQNDLAWDYTYGNADIMLGITDDGVAVSHEDLNTNIWVNPGEIAGNGIDDDNNGYIDDVNGWDFSSGNNDPSPNSASNDHGTHVSGICAGRTDNSIGISGVSGHSTILPIQFYGVGSWTATVCNASFTYAADNGANIVNTSYNIDGWVGDAVFTAGMQYMHDAGVLHFNSGGNGSDLNPPRQAFHQSLLTVSTDASDMKSGFSNYGTGMDISAPGSDIYSSVTLNGYGYKSGTSMAAPNAAGAAALIWSANPTWDSYQVAAQLLATAEDIDGVNPSFAGYLGAGRVNTYLAMSTTLGAPVLASTEGIPDEGTTVPPDDVDEFTIAFSQVMDPETVNDIANFEMIGAGPDNTIGTGDDIIYTLSTSTTYMIGTNYLTFEVTGPPLTDGLHQIRFVSDGLTNPFGTALDGDDNGTAGDDFIRNFTIGIPVPIADFEADNTSPVPDADVIFTDLTWGAPSAWTWTITPSTFSFVNGTDANSQNPEVQFADFGFYSVTLDVSNSAGSDTETKMDYINVITCDYCPAEGENGDEEWISNVTFNTINNSSGAGTGYTNYTSISTNVDAGSSHDISISCGSTGNWNEHYWVFFDWNQDCDFNDAGESYDLGETSGPGTLTTSVLVPADAVPGSVRMRAFLKYNADPASACEDGFLFGEVEDYTVVVGGSSSDCENFDALTAGGFVAEQLGDPWDTWSGTPGSSEDAVVDDTYAYSAPNAFRVDPNVDLIYKFGADPIASGAWLYSNMMYVASGTTGYFNVQSEPTPGVAWVIEITFNDGGTGTFVVDGTTTDFSYTQDAWFWVGVNIDVDNGLGDVWFDGAVVHSFETANTIGGIDFFGAAATDAAYYDDVCFEPGYEINPPAPPTDLEAIAVDVDIEVTWMAPSGEKSAVITNGVINPAAASAVEKSAFIKNDPAPASDAQFDLLFNFAPAGTAEAGIETDGMYIYTSVWSGTGNFLKYDQDGTFMEEFTIAGADGCRDMAYNGTYFYGGAASTTIFEMDFDFQVMVSTFTGPAAARAIAYNEVDDAFYCNNWSDDIVMFDMSGANLGSFPVGPVGASYYGLAFDNYSGGMYLWGYAQAGANTNELVQIELPSGTETGLYFDVGSVIDPAGSGIAGGLAIDNMFVPDVYSFVGNMQGIALWGLELTASTSLQGYNVYYSLNGGTFDFVDFTTSTTFTHEDPGYGEHCYYVTAVYDSGESEASNTDCEVFVGIEDNLANSTQVYPNPASSVVNIKAESMIQNVVIYNFAGQVVANEDVGNLNHSVNVSQFNPGVYIFQIETAEGRIAERIIIE